MTDNSGIIETGHIRIAVGIDVNGEQVVWSEGDGLTTFEKLAALEFVRAATLEEVRHDDV